MSYKEANAAARRIVAILTENPEAGEFVRNEDTGFRHMPEEVRIGSIDQTIRLSDMAIKPLGRPHIYPGIWVTWALRRFFARWRDQVVVPPACDHRHQSAIVWTENGYTSLCYTCKRVVFHGD